MDQKDYIILSEPEAIDLLIAIGAYSGPTKLADAMQCDKSTVLNAQDPAHLTSPTIRKLTKEHMDLLLSASGNLGEAHLVNACEWLAEKYPHQLIRLLQKLNARPVDYCPGLVDSAVLDTGDIQKIKAALFEAISNLQTADSFVKVLQEWIQIETRDNQNARIKANKHIEELNDAIRIEPSIQDLTKPETISVDILKKSSNTELSEKDLVGSSNNKRSGEVSKISQAIEYYDLCSAYYYGKGVKRDYLKALQYYEQAASIELEHTGQTTTISILPSLYYWAGRQLTDNSSSLDNALEKAVFCFKKSADLGDPYGTCELGRYYRDGRGVPVDVAEGFRLSKLAAEMGDFGGNYDLGLCYSKGIGVPIDYELAAKYYEEASRCNQGIRYSKALAAFKAIECWINEGNHAKAAALIDSIQTLLSDNLSAKEANLLKKIDNLKLDSIVIEAIDYTTGFVVCPEKTMIMYTTSNGTVVYDMDLARDAIMPGTIAYLLSEADPGLGFILEKGYPYTTYRNNKGMDAYITQMAIWWYLSESLTYEFRYADEKDDKYGLVPIAKRLVDDARKINGECRNEESLCKEKAAKIYKVIGDSENRIVGLF